MAYGVWLALLEQAMAIDSQTLLEGLFHQSEANPLEREFRRLSGDLRSWRIATSQDDVQHRPHVTGSISVSAAEGRTVVAEVTIVVEAGTVAGWLSDQEGRVVFEWPECRFGLFDRTGSVVLDGCDPPAPQS